MTTKALRRLLENPPSQREMMKRVDLPGPLAGLFTELPSEKVPPNKVTYSRNFRTYLAEMRLRDGLKKRGGLLDSSIMGFDEYALESGSTFLVATTKGKFFRYDDVTSAWIEIPKDASASVIAGSDDRQVSSEIVQDLFIFSDGDYTPKKWNGTGNYFELGGSSVPFAASAGFADRLVVGRTKEGGVVKPLRVRWPVSGDVSNWTGVGSGFVDIRDTPDWVQSLDVLSDELAVYKERSILIGRETGRATPAMEFDSHISGTGLLFPKGVGDLGDEHLFVGPDAIYNFRWSNLASIDDDIHTEFYKMLNMERLERMFSLIVEEFSEWLIFVVRTGKLFPDFVWSYNYYSKTWDNIEYPFQFSAAGFSSRATGQTFDQLTGTMDEQGWTGDDRTTAFGFPINIVGRSNFQVYDMDINTSTDDGTVITAEMQSKDFGSEDPNVEATVVRVVVRYRYRGVAAAIIVGVSVDGGTTWLEQTVAAKTGQSLELLEVHADIMATSDKFRFRAKATQQIGLIGFRIWTTGRGLRIS